MRFLGCLIAGVGIASTWCRTLLSRSRSCLGAFSLLTLCSGSLLTSVAQETTRDGRQSANDGVDFTPARTQAHRDGRRSPGPLLHSLLSSKLTLLPRSSTPRTAKLSNLSKGLSALAQSSWKPSPTPPTRSSSRRNRTEPPVRPSRNSRRAPNASSTRRRCSRTSWPTSRSLRPSRWRKWESRDRWMWGRGCWGRRGVGWCVLFALRCLDGADACSNCRGGW